LHKTASERNELLRSAFIASIGRYQTNQLVFMDELSKVQLVCMVILKLIQEQ
jgi:hypothetical protein